jgi:hypothetical protein
MTKDELLQHLWKLGACVEAVGWIEQTNGAPNDLWRKCKRADWMLWLAARADVDRKQAVLVACDCAETALRYARSGENRPRKAIEAARAWCRGECDLDEAKRAAAAAADAADAAAAYADTDAAAYAAAAAAYAAYAADAAYAAYAAAYAAATAAYADAAAAYAAYAADAAYAAYAADAAYAAYADAARVRCAALVRRRIKWSDVARGLK